MSVEFLYSCRRSVTTRYLSHHTKDPKYKEVIEAIYKTLKDVPTKDGLLPTFLDPTTGAGDSGDISMGAMADSYYEYLLKMWIQSGKKDEVRVDLSHHT